MVEKTKLTTIAETPLKWCSVALSEVVNFGLRIDATSFDIDFKKAEKQIEKCKFPKKFLVGNENSLCSAYRPKICKRLFVSSANKNAIPMLTPSQVFDVHPMCEKFLSPKMKKKIRDWFVNKGEILLSCSGTIGKTSIVTDTLKNMCVSQNMIRIKPKEPMYLGYIYAFLISKMGQLFLTKNNYGAVIQHIDPEHLCRIKIPIATGDICSKINTLILTSFALRDRSNELLDEATKLLITGLHLPPIRDFDETTKVNAFSVKLSELDYRADASYHLPSVNKLINHLKRYAKEVTTVGDERISKAVVLPGRFKRVYVEDESYGTVLYGGKNIHELDPSGKKYLSNVKHDSRIFNELHSDANSTLITRSGTVGKVALVPKHWENWVASDHIIRIFPVNDKIAGYLNVFLASEYGKLLITRYTYGSVVDEIDDNHVRSIAIPLLKNDTVQKKINELALQANELRYQAYCKEQEAIKIMNEEVIFAK